MIARARRRRPSWLVNVVTAGHRDTVALRSFEVGVGVGRTLSVNVDVSTVALSFRLGYAAAKDPAAYAALLDDVRRILDDHGVPDGPGNE